jgi:lipoprotein-releasing system permease protein
LVLGTVGTVLGVCFGALICTILKHYQFIELPADVYYFTSLPVMLEGIDVLVIASATLFLCLLATFYPAIQAAKLNPVDAVRYG